MPQITRNSDWRHIGAVPYETWEKLILQAGGSPGFADRRVWEAYGDDSALALAQAEAESSYASNYRKIPENLRDPLNLQVDGKGVDFSKGGSVQPVDAYVAGAREWLRRLYSPSYKNGVYTKTKSIYEMVSEFAPESDGNDPLGYSTKVAAHIKTYGYGPPVTPPSTPEEPVTTYNYSNGVHPNAVQIKVSEGSKFAGYIDPASHIIRAFVIHSAYGYLQGTTTYFQQGNALTDYMVGNSSDGAGLDGELRQFNDPHGPRYAWSSGPVSSPIEDAAKFLEIFGPNKEVVNMYTTSLERSGDSRNAVTPKEHAKRVALIAYHANEYGKYLKAKTGQDLFTCDTFPLIPSQNNRSFLIYHGEINADKRTSCPDSQVRSTIDRIVTDVKATLAAWQKGDGTSTPPVDPPPVDPPGQYAPVKPIANLVKFLGTDYNKVPAVVTDNGTDYIFVYDRVRAIKDTPRRQTAELGALKIGQDIKTGEEFAVLWLFETAKGEKFYLTPYWTRVLVSDTERIKDAA